MSAPEPEREPGPAPGPGPADAPTAAAVRTARRQGLAVGAATAVYGVSLGALAVANGLSVLQACATSLLLFSGGSQFALVGVLGGGGSAASAVAASTLLGVRNALYGVQVGTFLRVRGARRLLAAHWTIDESTAVGAAQGTDAARRAGFWVTGATVFAGWNLTTLAGALLGDALGDPRRYGLDSAAAAAFLALLWPRLRRREPVAVAVVAALVAAALVPVVPVGLPVVAAAAVALLAGLRGRRGSRGARAAGQR
ncbi:AzlC family ABC transporter permease [Kineococcus gypseus]|uniref:AzlC family ABC transporter permease n=1 Tax=Kineococcus gypseus TaxID=1637102 RepID=UPI003D7D1CA7